MYSVLRVPRLCPRNFAAAAHMEYSSSHPCASPCLSSHSFTIWSLAKAANFLLRLLSASTNRYSRVGYSCLWVSPSDWSVRQGGTFLPVVLPPGGLRGFVGSGRAHSDSPLRWGSKSLSAGSLLICPVSRGSPLCSVPLLRTHYPG